MKKEKRPSKYEYWFAGLAFLTGRKKIRLKSIFPDAEEIYRMGQARLSQIPWLTKREAQLLLEAGTIPEGKLEEEEGYCIENGIHLALWRGEGYPKRLVHIDNPPYGLFYQGELPKEGDLAVAIVGARECSAYGRQVAGQAGFCLAKQGVAVISGMASGIDGAGHRGALQAKGGTYGVLGCGVDVCYPAVNRELYGEVRRAGGIVSEYPPHMQPRAMFFPQRNRIISGMSDAVVVVEARKKSGALITADFALEQGREVYAAPGRIGDALSQGANRLIRQGAGIFLSPEDFLEELGFFVNSAGASAQKQKLSLEKSERLVYSCLDLSPKNLDELMAETGLSFPEFMENLESLRGKGCILEVYKNYYIRTEVSGLA